MNSIDQPHNKSEMAHLLDEVFLFWRDNQEFSFMEIIQEAIGKATEEEANLDFSNEEFLEALRELQSSLR